MAFVPRETQDQLVKLHKIIDKLEAENEKLGRKILGGEKNLSRLRTYSYVFSTLFFLSVLFVALAYLYPDYLMINLEDKRAYENLQEDYISNRKEKLALKATLDSLQAAYKDMREETLIPSLNSLSLVYTVQIGAFKKFRFPLISDNLIGYTVTYKRDWVKFSVGIFSTYREALILSNQLKKVGIGTPFIQAYKDGVAVTLKNARDFEKEYGRGKRR